MMKNAMKHGVRMAPFTTFHLGGLAEYFLEVKTENELVEAVEMAKSEQMPFFLVGGGSNLVVSDSGIKGLVIRNLAHDKAIFDHEKVQVTVSSGYLLSQLTKLAYQNSLTGFEFATGIPGTVGGAIYGNAGAYGKSIGDLVVSADILTPDGKVIKVEPSFFNFAYRTSVLKSLQSFVLNVTFKVLKGDKEKIRASMLEIVNQRKSKHPPREVGSAGSFFKNLDPNPGELRRRAAGEILEKAGVKNLSVGGAFVYFKHANFIVNYGAATASDVKNLASAMKDAVYKQFSIELHEEVLYVGTN
ncbi:UDP-N-acetylmuramate dehydrogenase [bacterium]|nr:UDP-N-acetylmuramate dehydrogenase [bacterium]